MQKPDQKQDLNYQPKSNQFWWPEKLNLKPLRQHNPSSNPYGTSFRYAEAFNSLDLEALKADLKQLMTDSQPWWPADYGNYGPFFIRMAWHSAGTYRQTDGRGGSEGGQQRFEPLNSWPDNANLDKARRLLWPIKKKYGRRISWSDLMVLAGNVALESMGFETQGFAGGREDDWEADLVYWGPETQWLDDKRYHGERNLEKPLAAVQMGLIYVNPEGPNGNPDPLKAAVDIRETFGRMAMNDEETVALIAGGHTFGKAHGAHPADQCLGPEPAGAPIEAQEFGWNNHCGKGYAEDTTTSGLEGSWSFNPTAWTSQYLDNLFAYNWVKTKSPTGAIQWIPDDPEAHQLAPDAHDASKRHAPIMFTTDLSLKFDPAYRKIAKRFQNDPDAFKTAFAKAWFKLTHRDMGPRTRYLGKDAPAEVMNWQDPLPVADYSMINEVDIAVLKQKIAEIGVSNSDLIQTAWASASTYRDTDKRGGANGARIRLFPQKNWAVNRPKVLHTVLDKLTEVQETFNASQNDTTRVSLADLIVLGGAVGVERAAKQAGYSVVVPFKPGRVDATQEQTTIQSFNLLKPQADGFRNYHDESNTTQSAPELLIERASFLHLTVPEMTVLIGGLRAVNANTGTGKYGVLTQRPGDLSNDFFVNLLDMSTIWKKSEKQDGLYDGFDRVTGQLRWHATAVDLIFGAHSELRAVAEAYASDDAEAEFVQDFVDAWVKVMQLDRHKLTS
ncbi:MAG: catalase/peroxidase HPI [Cyanobacteria bacterium P01_H01_bin.74]